MNIDQILLLFIQDYLRSDILSSRTFLLSMKKHTCVMYRSKSTTA